MKKNRIFNAIARYFAPQPRWVVLNQTYFRLFLTFSVIDLSNMTAAFIDGLIVSNFLSPDAMAASGIAYPMFSIVGIFSGMLAAGMKTLCSRELGRGNVPEFNRLFSLAVYLGMAFSACLAVTAFLWAQSISALLGASGDCAALAPLVAQYIRGLGLGFPALILTAVVAPAISMDSGRKRVMTGAIMYSTLNVLLDLATVKLHAGMFGIGLATSISEYVQLAYLCLHLCGKDHMLSLTPPKANPREALALLCRGLEKGIQRGSNFLRSLIVNILIISYGGTLAMSAMSIRNNLFGFTQFFVTGLADAMALMAGVFFGEMNDEAIRETGNCVHRNCALFCGGLSVALLLFAGPVAGLYVSEEGELRQMVVFAVWTIALQMPLDGLLRSRISYLQATQKMRHTQILTLLMFLVGIVFSALVMGFLFGAYGILACFLLSDVLCLAVVWLYFAIRHKKLFPTPEEYLDLPEDFQRSPGDIISLDVRDLEDVALVSQQISMFCKGHRIDQRTGNAAALCFEELAVNIIQHGFPNCKKSPGIDLRIVYHPKELTLRLQDNCPHFDIEQAIARTIYAGEVNPEEHIGLKILARMASDISYVHLLENNNVILHFPITAPAETAGSASRQRA